MGSSTAFWVFLPSALVVIFVVLRLAVTRLRGHKIDYSPISLDDTLSSSVPYGSGCAHGSIPVSSSDCGSLGSCSSADDGGCGQRM